MHDTRMDDLMQIVFDGAEEATDALRHMEGIERALHHALDPILARHRDLADEGTVWALVQSVTCFRHMAQAQIKRMQNASMGRPD